MNKPEPKTRRKLNAEQLEVLELLYKFRFGSNNLIADYFGKKDRSFVFKRLTILLEQGLIGKRFEPSYRIQGKPAAYYLTPAGARKVQEHREDKDEVNIKSIYKDKTVSEGFIRHCLQIFALYNQLKAEYDDKLNFFTKSDLAGYEHFPPSLPDAFLSLSVSDTKHFFLDVIDDNQPFFAAVRKIKQYLGFKSDGEWTLTETEFPAILLICESTSTQKRLQKRIIATLNKSLEDDIVFASTTIKEIAMLDEEDTIWQVATDPDNKVPLSSIQNFPLA